MIDKYHQMLRRLYNMRIGKLLWKWFCALINSPYVKFLIRKAMSEPVESATVPADSFLVPRIDFSCESMEKNILLVLPFYGPDAASVYIDSICEDFKNRGYAIHTLLYNDSHWRPRSAHWDCVYYLTVQTGEFGKLKRDKNGNVIPDGHIIDDWAGDELVQFAAGLTQLVNFKFCIVNYVFLSRIFTAIPDGIYKILVTHDIFSNRNSRIYDACGGQEGFYFSVEPDEEKKGLSRANLVLAIQEEDKRFFTEVLEIGNVKTTPYMPPKKHLAHRQPGKPLKIGYLGSGHHPNVEAMLQFVDRLKLFDGYVLLIGGSICNSISDMGFPDAVKLVGYISDIEDFYSKCDVIINPDMLRSGLKIKCIEALSFGKPLVCTEAASAGLFPESRYHTAKSIEECANIIEELVQNPETISSVADASKRLYARFYNFYHSKNKVEIYEALACNHAVKL